MNQEEMEDRVYVSPDQMMIAAENALRKLDVFLYDRTYTQILGQEFVDTLERDRKAIDARKKDPFTLAVIGNFKMGKSTFVNALLGEEVAPVDILPETMTVNRISYGIPTNEAVLSDSKRMRLSDEELHRSQLKAIFAQIPQKVSVLELKRPIEALRDLTIIDTPGLNDVEDFEELTAQAVLQADAVVFLYTMDTPLSMRDRTYLRSAVVPQKYTSLYLVANRCDALKDLNQYERLRGALEGRVQGILPKAETFLVSSLGELLKVMDAPPEETLPPTRIGKARDDEPHGYQKLSPPEVAQVLESQFDGLRAALRRDIDNRKDHVILDRVLRLTDSMIDSLRSQLDAIEGGLNLSSQDASDLLERVKKEQEESIAKQRQLRDEVREMVSRMCDESTVWMTDLLERMEQEIPSLRAQTSENLQKYYEMYCIDTLQEGMDRCLEYHQEILYDRIESVSETLLQEVSASLEDRQIFSVGLSLDNRLWTKGDTVGLTLGMAADYGVIGSLTAIVGDVVAGMMRAPEVKARSEEFVDQISGQIYGLGDMVVEQVRKIYKQMGDKAETIISGYYADELAALEHSVEQSVAMAHVEEARKDEIREAVTRARNILEECRESLQ